MYLFEWVWGFMKEISMLLVAVILWGIAIAPTKWALESIQPFTLLFLRLCFAGVGYVYCFLFSRYEKVLLIGMFRGNG